MLVLCQVYGVLYINKVKPRLDSGIFLSSTMNDVRILLRGGVILFIFLSVLVYKDAKL